MPTFTQRILFLRPDSNFAINGDDIYENIQWGNDTPIPEAELLAADAGIAAQIPIASAKAELDSILKSSIELMLDYIAKQPGAPRELKDLDALAKDARSRIPVGINPNE